MRLPGNIELNHAFAIWMRNFTVYRHTWKMNILPNFFEPVFYLLAMGIGLGLYVNRDIDGMGYLEFLAPGLLAAAAMNGAVFESTYNMFIKMNFSRVYEAYLTTPAELPDIAFGELMWAVTRSMIYGICFLLVLLGFTIAGRPILSSWWALLLPLVIPLIGAMFALIGQLFTSLIRAIDLYSYFYTLGITPLFLFSGTFFPLQGTLQTVAVCTPLYHCVQLTRDLAHGRVGLHDLASLAYIVVVIAVLMVVVPRRMRVRMVQ
ncbi:MAG: ABC transporter permease [Planctomycetota bacterium]